MLLRCPLIAIVAAACLAALNVRAADSSEGIVFFEKSVRPVLINRCYECHSVTKKVKGGLALDTRAATLKGGESGLVLVAGKPDESKLIEAVRYQNKDLQMPPKSPLPAAEVRVLEQWIAMGAPDPRTEAVAVERPKALHGPSIEEGRKHWAFQPLSSPAVPEIRNQNSTISNPIDHFILAKLTEQGLTLSPPTDKHTLLRRATFDLIGLPPTPKEIEAFVNDPRPDAFDRVIERLLASPHYGERWARHWLDVARYADSNGLDENVALGHAWRYRDYVIQSFNDDKPYDQFVIEQLAGDLLVKDESGWMKSEQGTFDTSHSPIAGTGFLALGAKVLAEPDVQKLTLDVIDEQIDTLGKAFLGMTFGCARCHDHKFDPVTQADYYALAAIFRSTKSLGDDRLGALKFWYEHSLADAATMEAKKQHEAMTTKQRAAVTSFTAKARTAIKTELQEHAADYLAAAAMFDMSTGISEIERIASEQHLRPRYLAACRQYLERHPEHPLFVEWRKLANQAEAVRAHYAPLFAEALASKKGDAYEALIDIAGFLAVPDKDADAFDAATLSKVEQMQAELMALEDKTPDPPAMMGVTDGDIVKTLPIHIRGSYLTLGKPVERGFPEVMRTSLTKPVMPAKESGRLELARWIASSEHPLTARVMANRLWRWHFGKGIVGSTDNFGLLGDKPTHPELLDWLARHFIEDGWSIKDMHRLIMRSATYQQGSSMADAGLKQDPENRLLWRANIQRLEAEEIRDAMLATSGWLDPKVGGKTIPLRNKEFVFNHTSKDHTTYESPRRAMYVPIIRNHLYDVLEQFDYPDPTMPTGSRNSTVIAPQALILMNSPLATECGLRLDKQLPAGIDDKARAQRVWQLLYGRDATTKEIEHTLDLLNDLRLEQGTDKAWALVCQSLISLNEFMYLR